MTTRNQTLFWLGLLVGILVLLWLLADILLPFLVGLAIAYFLDPIVDRLVVLKVPRGIASLIVLLVFLTLVVLVFLLLVPLLQGQVAGLIVRVPHLVQLAQGEFDRAFRSLREHLEPEDFDKVRQIVGTKLGDVFGWTAQLLQSLITSSFALFNILSLVFITPIVAFFLLRDWDRIVVTVDDWLPRRHLETIRDQARLVDETLAGYIRGQGTVCLVLGAYYAVALSIVGLEFGAAVGFLVGLLTFIPYIGATVGALLSVGLALAQFENWHRVGLVAAIFLIGQFVEGNFVTPKLVGDRVHLHPVWVMFALLAFGALFGFVGLLVAVPVAAVLGVLIRFALKRYLASPLYRNG
ncbi:MAG TPA: AI-2E family transporter [Candidatus Limnocylindria bacterium]|nr:AI-2E family transporter [Candidatus Limnocylindria bacterium]